MKSSLEQDVGSFGLACTEPLSAPIHREIVEHMALHARKWDVQVGDVSSLAPFAVTISRATCAALFHFAEQLTNELMLLEACIAERPDLWPKLGLPRRAADLLKGDEPWTPSAARIVRYDFHPTTEGWKISEVNSDVPGGMNEATVFTGLMAQQFGGTVIPGAPLEVLADALATAAGRHRYVAGVAASGLLEDQQVVASVGGALQQRGIMMLLVTPDQLQWDAGDAFVRVGDECLGIGTIYRFFQGEWVKRVASPQWRFAFRGGKTPVCNPAMALLTESKRLPLVWDDLGIDLPTWRELLPRTIPACSPETLTSRWVRKGSYSNTGESIVNGAWSKCSAVASAVCRGLLQPRASIAQERFSPVPLVAPDGFAHPCVGVYTINGRACGIYGRISSGPPIDYRARDVAILVSD